MNRQREAAKIRSNRQVRRFAAALGGSTALPSVKTAESPLKIEETGLAEFTHFDGCRGAFLESLRVNHYSPGTIAAYGCALRSFGRFAKGWGIKHLHEVTEEIIRRYQLDLESQGLKLQSRYAYVQPLRRFFAHLEKSKAIPLNPCSALRLPRVVPRLPQRLTYREACKLINGPDVHTAKGIRDRAILELFYSTGIRLAEMAALTLHDVECRAGLLRVEKGKGGKERVVPMGRKAVESLQLYVLAVRFGWISSRARTRPVGPDCALWLSSIEPHGPLKAQAIQVMVRQYGRRVGIRTTPHLWRHTCATHLVNNGASIAAVQRLLGHASLETTQIYTRVTINEVKAAYHKAHPRSRCRTPA